MDFADEAVELSMHLGRTGEAYFVMLDDAGELPAVACMLPDNTIR